MSSNPKIAAWQQRGDPALYPATWKVGLTKTCCERPGYCCFAMICGQCSSYSLRKQALYNDMTRYVCCNGAFPCSGRCGEQSCPEYCLCLEVCCCFAQSVATTRWMIQDELRVSTTKCDNCLIGFMIFMQYLACLCQIAACITGSDELRNLANIIDLAADILWCTVCACMQTQHKVELDERDQKNPGGAAPPAIMAPPGQQAIHTGYPTHGAPPPGYGAPGGYPPPPQGYGAPGGYPPPPGYGAPSGYPPQPAMYPPQGYGAPPPPYGAPPAPPGYPAMRR